MRDDERGRRIRRRQDLGYQGNVPNVWDGAPQNVLDKLGVKYDP